MATPVTADGSFAEQRRAAADLAFDAYDFGATEIEEMDGWTSTRLGLDMTRTLYLKPLRDGEPTDRAHFTVRFIGQHSILVAEAYAVTDHGTFFGSVNHYASA